MSVVLENLCLTSDKQKGRITSVKGHRTEKSTARWVALMGMLFALAAVLSFFEGLFPVAAMLPPGIKLGLSNIVTMYALFYIGVSGGFTVAVLKGLFVLLTRGPVAACMSLTGGLVSVAVMAVLFRLPHRPARTLISVFGAVFHNVGQLAAAVLVLRSGFAFGWLPVMILSGVGMGMITALLLRLTEPYLRQADRFVRKRNC